ncbi:hypothetical protein SeMB42_g05481 [Synchytrium endobioticum]|uniref:EDR1/CTR1/ARMC3-like peptidase-like domain-containing protein n=1 Tax=Synchytrium endobioticum TaxID=286115 RepID=A0A507DCA8_9FUNG|nr:hypothetical protein SeMB42_g05481 [Synchytrium endobioticum]TPX49319.1 hypothetical protein SeLEV6574_g01547 [Synchytrium endobioticum]
MESTQCDPTSITITDIRTLILVLKSPESTICTLSADALTRYAENSLKHRIQLLNLGIVPPLLDLARSKDAAARRSAAACLAASTENVDAHQDMRRRDLIAALVALLSGEAPEIQEESAFALANLAKDFANKTEIRSQGGIKALIRLLDSPDPDCRKNGAHALAAVLDDFPNRHEFRTSGGVQPLLELLNAEFLEIQENALLCLVRCTQDSATRLEVRKTGGIKKLIDALKQDSAGLHHLTLLCISNCLEDGEMAFQFIENGGIQATARTLTTEEAKTKRHASLVVSRAARNEKANGLMKDAGVLLALTANVLLTDAQTVASAALAIATLAKSDVNRQEFLKLATVEALFARLTHDDHEVLRNVEWALAVLSLNAKVRARVRSLDAPARVLALLQQYNDDAGILAAGCEFLANMAEDSDLRGAIIKQGAVSLLVSVLNSADAHAVASAALALSRVAMDVEGRILIDENTAISKLTGLLTSPDLQIVRNASYAVAAACQLDANAQTACKAGAVSTLVNLSRKASTNASNFATEALNQLLDYHLPVKYWLTSRLDMTDTIQTPFYDLGQASPCDTHFPTLSDLQSFPVNQKREILLVDFATDSALNALVNKIISENSSMFYSLSRADQIQKLARAVSDAMGGAIPAEQQHSLSFQFRIAELKIALSSNVIPLGKIDRGGAYHRALLFKALCDRVGIKSALIRGNFNKYWNVVDLNGVTARLISPPVEKMEKDTASVVGGPGRKQSILPAPVAEASWAASKNDLQRNNSAAASISSNDKVVEHLVSVDVMTEPGALTPYKMSSN